MGTYEYGPPSEKFLIVQREGSSYNSRVMIIKRFVAAKDTSTDDFMYHMVFSGHEWQLEDYARACPTIAKTTGMGIYIQLKRLLDRSFPKGFPEKKR